MSDLTWAVAALHLAATLFMTGLIWFVQIVHYPLMARVGAVDFASYEAEHQRRTTWLVLPPMLIELATAMVLALLLPGLLPAICLGLLALIWASTFLLQVPCHDRLRQGFDSAVHQRLVRTNWLRTAAWSLRSLLACFWLIDS